MLFQEEIDKTKAKEKEVLRLLEVKSEKIANKYLLEKRHTQLSYLSKEEQEWHITTTKNILLDKIISYLKSL